MALKLYLPLPSKATATQLGMTWLGPRAVASSTYFSKLDMSIATINVIECVFRILLVIQKVGRYRIEIYLYDLSMASVLRFPRCLATESAAARRAATPQRES